MYNADTPITRIEDDTLGRVSFSKHLAKAIIDYKAIDSVCIGLLGKWGSGKTSLNTTKEMIDEHQQRHKRESAR